MSLHAHTPKSQRRCLRSSCRSTAAVSKGVVPSPASGQFASEMDGGSLQGHDGFSLNLVGIPRESRSPVLCGATDSPAPAAIHLSGEVPTGPARTSERATAGNGAVQLLGVPRGPLVVANRVTSRRQHTAGMDGAARKGDVLANRILSRSLVLALWTGQGERHRVRSADTDAASPFWRVR